MLELVSHPPTTAKQLLALVQQHTATLNAAVQHLPAAPHWSVSPAVKKGASQLVQLLQTRSFDCWGKENPGLKDGSLQEGSGIEAAGEGAEAAAAGTAGSNSSSSRSTGLPLMVNGQLVQRAGAAVPQKEGRKKSKRDGDFRERLIKKFSAKTQVRERIAGIYSPVAHYCYCYCPDHLQEWAWFLEGAGARDSLTAGASGGLASINSIQAAPFVRAGVPGCCRHVASPTPKPDGRKGSLSSFTPPVWCGPSRCMTTAACCQRRVTCCATVTHASCR
jgi:hypothetical protein